MDQKEQASQVPNSFPATTGKKLNPNAPEFIPRTSSSNATQPPPSSSLTLPGSSEKSNRFDHDIYENELPKPEYYTKDSPLTMEVVICWPHRVTGFRLKHLEPKFYMHGIFSDAKAVWYTKSVFKNTKIIEKDQEIVGRLLEAEEMFNDYANEILKYWPNLIEPLSFEAAKDFILREWKKHGYRTGMNAMMYLYYGLAVRNEIPNDFGIPIGVPIPLKDVLNCAQKVMDELSLFGKPIGKNIIPKILFGRMKILGAFTIDEIQLKFTRIVIDNESKAKLQATSTKPFSGPTEDVSTLLILPSREQMEQLPEVKAKGKSSGGVQLKSVVKKFVCI